MTDIPRFEDSPAYRKGVAAEQTVERLLQDRGFFTIRLCNIRNHEGIGAPMMMGARANLILPDYQVVDVKGEKPPFLSRSSSRRRRGPVTSSATSSCMASPGATGSTTAGWGWLRKRLSGCWWWKR